MNVSIPVEGKCVPYAVAPWEDEDVGKLKCEVRPPGSEFLSGRAVWLLEASRSLSISLGSGEFPVKWQ